MSNYLATRLVSFQPKPVSAVPVCVRRLERDPGNLVIPKLKIRLVLQIACTCRDIRDDSDSSETNHEIVDMGASLVRKR